MTAYVVLSHGLLGGQQSRGQQWAPGDFRALSPRVSGDNLEHNLTLVEALRAIAEAKVVSLAHIVIG